MKCAAQFMVDWGLWSVVGNEHVLTITIRDYGRVQGGRGTAAAYCRPAQLGKLSPAQADRTFAVI